MEDKPEKEKQNLEDLDRILKGKESDIKESLDDDSRSALEFARKMKELREKPSKEFVENLNGESPRIISMFKSIQPEMDDDHTIRLHLTNAAQKDIFIQNYKQRLSGFMENKFLISELDIETSVDLSETNELLYTDEQKYNFLLSKYPALKDFSKAFNLDIP